MVEEPPQTNGNHVPATPVNGFNTGQQVKVEQSPAVPYQEPPNHNSLKHRVSFPQPMFIPPQAVPQPPPQSPLNPQQPWPGTYPPLPQPQSQGPALGQRSTLASPIYPTYSQATTSGLSTPGTYPS